MKFGALFSKIKSCVAPSADGPERMIASPWGATCTGGAGATRSTKDDAMDVVERRDGFSRGAPAKAAPAEAPQIDLWSALCRAKAFPNEKPARRSGEMDVTTLTTWGAFSMCRL